MAPPPSAAAQPRPILRCIVLIILAIIVLVGLIVLIIWLTVQPRKLKYSIEHASITNYNLTRNDHFNANFYFVLRANNPNRRISLYYDRIDVSVQYEDRNLAVNNVGPFYQRRRNVTHLDLNLSAKDASLYGAVARDMRMERSSGDLNLDVKIRAKIRLKIGVFKMRRTLKVVCPLTVPFDSTKGFTRAYCDVDIDD